METLTATTNQPIKFEIHLGTKSRTEVIPAGTVVEFDSYEMESNPQFFHIQVADTELYQSTYINLSQIDPR